jgi:uncharacterized protein (TIGR02246 family)
MRRLYLGSILVLSLGLVGLTLACRPQAPPDTRAADEQAIRTADAACLQAAQAKDLERLVACYAEDAAMFPPNVPIATGREAIRANWSQLFAAPGYALSWQPTRVEVSRGGDLGYGMGSYELTLNDSKGKPVVERGKYVNVWRKQADGSWRMVADIWNSDQPPPTPPTR